MEKFLNIRSGARQLFFLLPLLVPVTAYAQQQPGFSLVSSEKDKRIDIVYNGQRLTSYCYFDSIRKPILFPVNTLGGTTVTRGYPLQPVPGDRTDHPHHTGIWLNYESVNGLDFWNNSPAIAPANRYRYGTIVHKGISATTANGDHAKLTVEAEWQRPDEKVLLYERTAFHFGVTGGSFIIDRITELKAADSSVLFKDVKDGFFAIRAAREFEMPSREKSSYIGENGAITATAPPEPMPGGQYVSSEGLRGDEVWGTRARWVSLTGKKNGKDIAIVIFDHPSNTGYPSYWHARGYGLFAVNPLGRKVFSNGKDELNLSLKPGESVIFRYRLLVHEGSVLTGSDLERLAADFGELR